MLGLAFSVAGRVWLGDNWSGTVTLKQDHELIRSGPYRWVRHPIYTGLLLAILGSAIALGEWRGLVALALVAVAFLRKVAIEERFLARTIRRSLRTLSRRSPGIGPDAMARI